MRPICHLARPRVRSLLSEFSQRLAVFPGVPPLSHSLSAASLLADCQSSDSSRKVSANVLPSLYARFTSSVALGSPLVARIANDVRRHLSNCADFEALVTRGFLPVCSSFFFLPLLFLPPPSLSPCPPSPWAELDSCTAPRASW